MATKSRKLARKHSLIPTKEVNEEAKSIQKINMMSVTKEASCLHKLLEKHNLWKILRITAWIIRFIFNLMGKPRRCGVLSTFELQEALNYWIKVMQNEALTDPSFEDISNRLGLMMRRAYSIAEDVLLEKIHYICHLNMHSQSLSLKTHI